MNESEFRQTLDELCDTNSRNEKKEIVSRVSDSPAAISFLSGSEYDDIGLGKKTVHSVAEEVFGSFEAKPTVSEALESFDDMETPDSSDLEDLRTDMDKLAELSGNDMEGYLFQILAEYNCPSVVSHACLDDLPTKVGDSTIAKALDLEESLPFYESVVEAAAAHNPVAEPMVGFAFDPQLAVPESRGEPDGRVAAQTKIDGYRCLIHVTPDRVKAFSRRHNEITESLPELEEIDWLSGKQFILDCEVLAETGSYSDTSERIGRKAENVERDVEMEFHVFDIVKSGGRRIYERAYWERYGLASSIVELASDERVKMLELERDIEAAKDRAIANGEEGIIVKALDAPYSFERSADMQKKKVDEESVDLVVSDFEEGEGEASGTLGKIALETADGVHVGNSGSGFSDEERDEIWQNRDEWLGRTVEIEARGIGSEDKLRMPIYKKERSDDGEPDSFERVNELMEDV
jgi:ATP-dependent DNA ligase